MTAQRKSSLPYANGCDSNSIYVGPPWALHKNYHNKDPGHQLPNTIKTQNRQLTTSDGQTSKSCRGAPANASCPLVPRIVGHKY